MLLQEENQLPLFAYRPSFLLCSEEEEEEEEEVERVEEVEGVEEVEEVEQVEEVEEEEDGDGCGSGKADCRKLCPSR